MKLLAAIDPGMVGAVVGIVGGLVGGTIGTYAMLKTDESHRIKAFYKKLAVVGAVYMIFLVVGFFFVPQRYRLLVRVIWLASTLILLMVPRRIEARIRREEAEGAASDGHSRWTM